MNTEKVFFLMRKILAYRRRHRVNFMLSKVIISSNMNIVDIGCGVNGRSFDDYISRNWKITGIDILPMEHVHHNHPKFVYIRQDAQNLSSFKDKEFDLAVSIGMLEHITQESSLMRIVSEIRRVATQYIVIVPYKYCWIEPHYGVPFFPLLPYSVKLALVKALNLSNHRDVVTEDPDYIQNNYRWLSNKEYSKIFPESKIYILPTLETIAIVKKNQI